MSRARPVAGEWWDMKRSGEQASEEQLELLATVENVELDDLLDADLSQGDVVLRLRNALGENRIPDSVLKRRERLREARHKLPNCRICEEIGDSTRHHFVNKWILRELEHYARKWSSRTLNTIPICLRCHRKLHLRSEGPHSIVPYLEDREKEFAEAALEAFADEHPRIVVLLARGDDSVYESRLMKDWILGLFRI